VFDAADNLVMLTDQGVYRLSMAVHGEARPEFLVDPGLRPGERFNDATADAAGRVIAGTMMPGHFDGRLFVLEKGKLPRVVLDGIGISNGMAFTPDRSRLLHTDSKRGRITSYRFDPGTAVLSDPRVFYQAAEPDGIPDGITRDADGCVWVACWGASQVVRLDEGGALVERLPIPAMQVSSVMFGGDGLADLYVTTSCEGHANRALGTDAQGRFLGGYVYQVAAHARGVPEWPAIL
jgi:sugar lactone lactonase YvrE